MKLKIPMLYLAAAAFAMTMTGCSKSTPNELPIPPAPEPGGKVELQLAGSAIAMSKTKAADTSFPAGIEVGVYPLEAGTDLKAAPAALSNLRFTADGAGKLVGSTVMLVMGGNYVVYAYAPRIAAVADPTAIPFDHGIDVMSAPVATITEVTQANRTAALAFVHACSQVSYEILFNAAFTGDRTIDATTTLAVIGFYPSAILDIATGLLTPVGTPDTQIAGAGTAAGTLITAPVCFFPNASQLAVTVTHKGEVYKGTINQNALPGNAYRYTVTINSDAKLQCEATLIPWVPVDESITVLPE